MNPPSDSNDNPRQRAPDQLVENGSKPVAQAAPLPFPLLGPLVPRAQNKTEAAAAFRSARLALRMTPKEIGALLKVNPRTIDKWEQGGEKVEQTAWALLQLAARFPVVRDLLV